MEKGNDGMIFASERYVDARRLIICPSAFAVALNFLSTRVIRSSLAAQSLVFAD